MEVAIVLLAITFTIVASQAMWSYSHLRDLRKLRRDLIRSGVITPHRDQD